MNRETRKLVRRMKFHRLISTTSAIRAATIRPARRSGVLSDRLSIHSAPARTTVRQARPNSNLRLKSMLLHAPIEGAPAKAELGGGKRDVEVMHAQGALDHLLFELVEVEAGRHDRH